MAAQPSSPPMDYAQPTQAGYPMYVPQPMASVTPPGKAQRLLVGTILRIIGAIIGGADLIWLGVWLSDPTAMVNFTNPLAPFQTMGLIVALAGVSVMFTGIGWSIQSWGRGL